MPYSSSASARATIRAHSTKRIDLERRDVSADELYYTASQLINEINNTVGEVDFLYSSSSVMP